MMRSRAVLSALAIIAAACDHHECGGVTTAIGCEDTLEIRLTEPLSAPGRYTFELSGARNATCSFSNPAGPIGECGHDFPVIEGNRVAGLVLNGRVDGTLRLTVRVDGRLLLMQSVVPSYVEPKECSGLCATAKVSVDTTGIDLMQEPNGGTGS